jgi:hypothetical protein
MQKIVQIRTRGRSQAAYVAPSHAMVLPVSFFLVAPGKGSDFPRDQVSRNGKQYRALRVTKNGAINLCVTCGSMVHSPLVKRDAEALVF